MAEYFWDLGFDLNAFKNRHGEYFLPNGCALNVPNVPTAGDNRNVPATPVGINVGDTITYNAFNITAKLPIGSSYSILEGSIHFNAAVEQFDARRELITSPFKNSDGSYMSSLTIPRIVSTTTSHSAIFSGVQAPQLLSSNQLTNSQQFPFYSLASLKVANAGRFMMSLKLVIQIPSPTGVGIDTQTFLDDPEMIVGGPAGG